MSPWGPAFISEYDSRWPRQAAERMAQRYEAIKRSLADARATDSDYDDYTRGKTSYLDEVQPKFEVWAATEFGETSATR